MDLSPAASAARVLIVLASNDRRGAEIDGARLAAELGDRGFQTEAVALACGSRSSTLDVPVLGTNPFAVATLRALRSQARDFDVVIAYGSSSLPACAIGLVGTRVPFIYRSIGDPAAWLRGRVHRWRTRLLLSRAAHVVALWPGGQDAFRSLHRIGIDRVSVIANARSPEEFRPPTDDERAEAKSLMRLPHHGAVVGWIGSMSEEKRPQLAVDAVAEVPGVHLLLVGDGPLRADVERHARDVLDQRSTFTGVLDEVRYVYRAIDVLLVTSRTEGMPGVVLEAAMSGVPIIATEVGAIPWLFEEGVSGALLPVAAAAGAWADSVGTVARAVGPVQAVPLASCSWAQVAERWASLICAVGAEHSHQRGVRGLSGARRPSDA
jgi:glycosyltransferase involved in cell wall biosynthesis